MTPQQALLKAREVWPSAKLRKARHWQRCDNQLCRGDINTRDYYVDPGDANPERAGGFGGYRYCVKCGGGDR